MSKHTPELWEYGPHGHGDYAISLRQGGTGRIALVDGAETKAERSHHAARIVAAYNATYGAGLRPEAVGTVIKAAREYAAAKLWDYQVQPMAVKARDKLRTALAALEEGTG